jgi:hypothetical protein
MKKSMVTGLLVVGVLITGCTRDKRSLAIDVHPGEAYRYTVSTTQTLFQSVMDTTLELTQTTTWFYVFQVVEIDDRSVATIDVMYDEIGLESEGPFGSMAYRSWEHTGEVPGAVRAYSMFLDKHVTMKLSPDGRVLSVTGSESIIDEMIDALGLDVDSASLDRVRIDLRNQFGNRALAEALSVLFPHYPERSVGPGDAWGDRSRLTCGLPMAVRNAWHVRSVLDGTVVLDAYGMIGPNLDVRFTSMPGTEMYYSLRGQKTGEYTIDDASGLTIDAILQQQVEGVVVLSGMVAGQLQTARWPLRVVETTTIKTGEIKDSTVPLN